MILSNITTNISTVSEHFLTDHSADDIVISIYIFIFFSRDFIMQINPQGII